MNIDLFCDITYGRKEQYDVYVIPGCGFWSKLEFSEARAVHVTPALVALAGAQSQGQGSAPL